MQNLGHASLSRVNLKQTRGRYGHKPIEFILISTPSDQSQSKTLGPRPLVNMMISLSTWMTVGSPTIQFLGRQVSGLYSSIIWYVQGAILRFEFIMLANTSIGRFKVFGRFWLRGSDQGLYVYPEYPLKVQYLSTRTPVYIPFFHDDFLAEVQQTWRLDDRIQRPILSWINPDLFCIVLLVTFNYSHSITQYYSSAIRFPCLNMLDQAWKKNAWSHCQITSHKVICNIPAFLNNLCCEV